MHKKNLALFVIFICIIASCLPIFAWSFFSRTPEPTATAPTPTLVSPAIKFTLIINPGGDARDPGREIDETFEQIISMQCAEAIKKELEQKVPGVRVMFTRSAGEIAEPLQNASLVNRLNADLYVSLNFFHQKEKANKLFIYRLIYNPKTDIWSKKSDELSLMPYTQAYRLSLKTSESISTLFYDECKKETAAEKLPTPLICIAPKGIPYKPLVGITAPAIGLEIGIRKKDDWKDIVPILIHAFEALVETKTS